MSRIPSTGMAGLMMMLWMATPIVRAQFNNPAADTIPRFESIAPQPMPEDTSDLEKVKPPPQAEVTDETELVEELKGLWFTAKQDDILAEGRKEPLGVTITGLPLLEPEEIRQQLRNRLGVPVTLKHLNEIVKDIVTIYRDNDLPVVDVIIPEQDITTGVVQILVLEGKVEDIRAEGNRWFSDRRILGPIRLERGGRILSKPLVEDLRYLNRNPFREVEVYFTPGDAPGLTDVVLKTQDRFPVRFYAGYEDTGNDITSEERLLYGFNWGNVFGLDHTLNYQYTMSPNWEGLRSHSVSYDIPVFRDHRLNFFGSYSNSFAPITSTGDPKLETEGTSIQGGFRYRHLLPGSGSSFQHYGTFGLDHRRVYNELNTGPIRLTQDSTAIHQWMVGYSLDWVDPLGGIFQFEGNGFLSPGGVVSHNDRASFRRSRPDSDPNYNYIRASLERRQPLWKEFELQGRIQGQLSDTNLLSTEQFGIGGFNTVRGYSEYELRGDQGWFTNVELYTPPIRFDRIFDWAGHPVELRFLGFWDYGQVANIDLLPGENPDGELSSAGGGLRLFVDRYFTARMDYGFQLLDSGFNKRFDSRIHLGLIMSY